MFKKIFYHVLRPLCTEWPFFIIFLFLISQTALKTLLVDYRDMASLKAVFLYLSLASLISYIATLILYLSKSKLLKIVFYIVGLVLFAVYLFLWLVFGTSLSPTIIQILGETNSQETSEFIHSFILSSRSLITVLCLTAAIVGIVFLEKKAKAIRFGRMIYPCGIILTFVLCVGLYKSHIYYTLLRTSTSKELSEWTVQNSPYFPMDMVTTLAYSLHGPVAVNHDIEIARTVARKVYDSPVSVKAADRELTVVYILGESYIKHHAGIYGYRLPTTPNLTKERDAGNLFVFNDAMSASNSTTDAEKNTFSLNNLSKKQFWYDHPMFTTVFKHAGYQVYMWDLQRTWDDNAVFTFSVNAYIYDKEISRLSYTESNSRKFTYDGDLVDDFMHRHRMLRGRNLLVFHLIGQHVDARSRYPHDGRFERFKVQDIRRNERWMTDAMRQDIANYDNATYYNDWVIAKIINSIRDRNAVMVYLSDHGEEIYDYRPQKGRSMAPMTRQLQQHQFAIPLVVWCSDKYKQLHPEVVQALSEAVDRPLMSDNIGQTMLHLGGIDTPYYRPEHDVLSDKYQQGVRRLSTGDIYED